MDHVKDPWDPMTSVETPTGWFTLTQQFSDPEILFYPNAHYPSFAICQTENLNEAEVDPANFIAVQMQFA